MPAARVSDRPKKDSNRKAANKENIESDEQEKQARKERKAQRRADRERRRFEELVVERRDDSDEVRRLKGTSAIAIVYSLPIRKA